MLGWIYLSIKADKPFLLTLSMSYPVRGAKIIPKCLSFKILNRGGSHFWGGGGSEIVLKIFFDNSYAISNKRNIPIILKVEPSDLLRDGG